MGKKSLTALIVAAIVAGSSAGLARAEIGPIEQCPGGSCGSRHCKACCPAGKNPSCSWWSCKCQSDHLAAASVGVGSIIDP